MIKICKVKGCTKPTVGKSAYCKVHRDIAREKWLANIEGQKQARASKYQKFNRIWSEAVKVAERAMQKCTPTPMIVAQHANPLDDNSEVTKSYYVPQGLCGFAWVNVSPGNSSFANWLKKQGHARKSYRGGVDIWIRVGGQSFELKEAYAYAMAEIFHANAKELGIRSAYANSRLD